MLKFILLFLTASIFTVLPKVVLAQTRVTGCGTPVQAYTACVACSFGHGVYKDDCGNYSDGEDETTTVCANYQCNFTAPPAKTTVDLGPEAAGAKQLQELILRGVNLIIEVGFIASLFISVWGGVKYLTSGGETKAVEQANQVITWAFVGILFFVVAYLILLVIKALTGVDLTGFCLGFPGGPNTCANP